MINGRVHLGELGQAYFHPRVPGCPSAVHYSVPTHVAVNSVTRTQRGGPLSGEVCVRPITTLSQSLPCEMHAVEGSWELGAGYRTGSLRLCAFISLILY